MMLLQAVLQILLHSEPMGRRIYAELLHGFFFKLMSEEFYLGDTVPLFFV
ncbi:hypothetical protein HYX00_03635 [Candidatus Woesearchaeota archaeon]|nr:hypothetical protein [Candidatus Woesearchaeota archaeon]